MPLSLAREHFATDSVLEVLFRMAVTAGKRIKTEVAVSHGNPSVIHRAVEYLRAAGIAFREKPAWLSETERWERWAQTLPAGRSGCNGYGQGIQKRHCTDTQGLQKELTTAGGRSICPFCDLIVSATASPNFTLREEHFEAWERTKPLILIDLAVPERY